MATLGLVVANDIANALLTMYVRGMSQSQTTTDKPLMKALAAAKKTFPGGKDNVSLAVKGTFMSDTAGFLQGYTGDDSLNFGQSQNILRASYPWRECHAGLEIAWTELKQDGITITDHSQQKVHSEVSLIRLTDLLQERMEDFGESWNRALQTMFWEDGTLDAKLVPGITSILNLTVAAGVTGGIDRATNSWWNQRILPGITPSAENQTLTKTLRSELRLLRTYGGKPNRWFGGSEFISALELEVQEKGNYTLEGFTNENKTDVGMADISMKGLGKCVYDPFLDQLGQSKFSYVYDDRRITWYPMQDEENKLLTPERPYNYMVFFKSMTTTGALVCNQLNCNGIYSVA